MYSRLPYVVNATIVFQRVSLIDWFESENMKHLNERLLNSRKILDERASFFNKGIRVEFVSGLVNESCNMPNRIRKGCKEGDVAIGEALLELRIKTNKTLSSVTTISM